jgi:CheY-like chemotaxis protein
MRTDYTERRRVMVVNDDQKVLDLLVELLEREEYDVASTTDSLTALAVIASFGPDAIVSDVVMPGINGIELCRLLKQGHARLR